jgi:uncharacterized delta-60 repeat protein
MLAAVGFLLAPAVNPVAASPLVAWTAIARGSPEVRDAAPIEFSRRAMVVDAAGNAYVTGFADDGREDIILTVKYDAAGTPLWRAFSPGTAAAIAVDTKGNVYVTGSVRSGYQVFDTHDDFLTVKYAPDGTELWNVRAAASLNTYGNTARAVTVDSNGNVYVTGAIDINYPTSRFLSIKYNSDGQEQWRAYANQSGYMSGVGIAVDSSQNVFVTGTSAYGGPNNGYLTVKYDSSGTEKWRAIALSASTDTDSPIGLALDPVGAIVVTGNASDYPYSSGFFTVKYANGGQEQWRAVTPGPDPYPSNGLAAGALAVDGGGNIYVTGGPSSYGFVTVKYSPNGAQVWEAFTHAPPGIDSATAHAIAVDSSGAIYVTGEQWTAAGRDYLTVKYDAAGAEQWRQNAGAAQGTENIAYAMGLDANANVYVTGFTDDGGQYDFLTIKYGPSGSELWRASAGTLPSAASLGWGYYFVPQGRYNLAVDASGNAHVLGVSFRYETDIFLQPIVVSEFLTVKYDPAGNELWRATFNGTQDDEKIPGAIAIDSSGNVYVTGWLSSNGATSSDAVLVKYDSFGLEQWSVSLNFCAIPEAMTIDTGGAVIVACDGYVTLKYDAAGSLQWRAAAAAQAGITPQRPSAVETDAAGSVYVTGSGAVNSYVTVKYDAAGIEQWRATTTGGTVAASQAKSLAVDSYGNVFVAGGGFNQGLHRDDFLTIKYDSAGTELWRRFGNIGGNHLGVAMITTTAHALKLDPAGNIYIAGQVGNATDFDYATIKYDPSGMQQWVAIAKGSGNGDDDAFSLAVDPFGNAYVTGQSYNGANFDFLTIRYNSAGVEQWRMTGANPLHDDFAAAVKLAPDGSVYVAGTSTPPGQPSGIMLQKIVQSLLPTSTTLSSSLNPALRGQMISFTATVSGHRPTGNVDFRDGGTTICASAPLAGAKNSATATCTTAVLTAGTHAITASYSGDANNAGSVSAPLSQTVNPPPPGVTLTSSLNPSQHGIAITFTAVVAGQMPGGTVSFTDGGVTLCATVPLQGGGNSPIATCTTSTLAVGKHKIKAAYSGDANNVPKTSKQLKQKVTN